MQTKIQKWGNSYAVRLPKPMVVRMGLRAGTWVRIDQRDDVVMVQKEPKERPVRTRDWRAYLIPTKRNVKENVSERIDQILYGKPD